MSSSIHYHLLSHRIDDKTPCYGNRSELAFDTVKSISRGDSCNKSSIRITNHVGTHVDMPLHFLADGRCVADYSEPVWFFYKVLVLDVSDCIQEGALQDDLLSRKLPSNPNNEAILLKTGMGVLRKNEVYWRDSPIFRSTLANLLLNVYPKLQLIGLDCISIASLNNRVEGRLVHEAFLSRGVLIAEDLNLNAVETPTAFTELHLIPHFGGKLDATPVTVLAFD